MTTPERPARPDTPSRLAPMELTPDRLTQPIIGTEEVAASSPPAASKRAAPTTQSAPLLLGAVVSLLLVALGMDVASLAGRAFAESWVLGAFVLSLLALAIAAGIRLIVAEIKGLRRLRSVDALRQKAEQCLANGEGRAETFVTQLAAFYADDADRLASVAVARGNMTDAHNDEETLAIIERTVFLPVDEQAYALVVRAARTCALATALSPAAILDLAIVLWRNLRLTREIATLYGCGPGPVGAFRLLRRMVINLAVAGATESTQHAITDVLGGSLAAAVSARLGQGILNGLLTARIGLTAMRLCRPMPFSPPLQPTLKRIRAEVLAVPKSVI